VSPFDLNVQPCLEITVGLMLALGAAGSQGRATSLVLGCSGSGEPFSVSLGGFV